MIKKPDEMKSHFAMHRLPAVPDAAGWYHIMPMGRFQTVAHRRTGERVEIVEEVDAQAIERIMHQYAALRADPQWPGYLVSREHYAQDPDGDTEAHGWAVELQSRHGTEVPERERGIWARIEKTPLGETSIGKSYRYFSTVNDLELIAGHRYRPVSIDDIGLTNKPAYKTLMPARHRRQDPQTQETPTMLEKIRELLARHKVALKPDADEPTALAALDAAVERGAQVDDLTQRADRAEHRVQALETADLERQADAFVAKHHALLKDPVATRSLFVEHRAAAEALIEQIKPAAPPPDPADAQRVLHRDGAAAPDASPTAADADRAFQREREQREFVSQVRAEHRLPSNAAAWPVAQRLRPDLF